MTKYLSPTSFSAGLVIGALLATAWFYGDSLNLSSSSARTDSQMKSSSVASDLITVSDQSAGNEVIIKEVDVPAPGVWAAIREVRGEDLGNVLGAARVGGPRTDVVVSLLRATLPGHTYAVMLYRDDNEGAFDPAKNSTYVDFETGGRVVVEFDTNP